MHIRFITSTPLNVDEGSGTFVGIMTLARSLRALGATVNLVTPAFRFPVYTLQRLLFNETLRFRRQSDCDITVGFDMDGYAMAGVGRRAHVAAVKGVIADEMRFESGLTKGTMRIQAAFEKLHVHQADLVITTSQYASARIQELYALQKAPRVIPELIDLAAWNKLFLVNPTTVHAHKFIVLTVCRFYPRKRLNILLLAARRLRCRIPGLEVRIIGGGPEAARLKDFCRKNGLQSIVTWHENISQTQLAQEYNQCDIFCLPSVQEGFGLVFLEAMANGKSIVAARAGAAPEVVKHGLLVAPDDEQALAEAIERLYQQPALRKSLGTAGQEFVRQFDAPVVAGLFLQELERVAMHAAAGTARPKVR
jgi:glycosyltransferase involved in cell wall biosynthesis